LLLDLARHTIRQALTHQPPTDFSPDDAALLLPAGCFCSLHAQHTHVLRGCVGMLDAHEPIYRAVQHSARAVLRDPRFANFPVRADELHRLEIELSIVSPMRDCETTLDFDLMNDGIYLTVDGSSGCFLPQVARETGWTKEQLLERLCAEKMDVDPDAWQKPEAHLQKFTTQILGPEPFVADEM
jgi:AmmeMemoRadiSam system protein A